MKLKFVLAFVLGITVFSQYSCSNEVEVIGLWKDIPVVYGVINQSDSLNYIRIERAYLPPNKSALEVAKNPDSLYFDPADVDVDVFWINVAGDTFPWPIPLERVNLANEGILRDSGIFQHDPSYAYKMVGTTGDDLLLKINNRKTGNIFYARTESVNSTGVFIITTPSYSLNPYRPVKWREINPQGDEVFSSITVEVSPGNFAAIYDYQFRFHYKEYEVDNQGVEIAGTRKDKNIIWKAASDFIPSGPSQTKRVIKGETFYQFLGGALSNVEGTNIKRCASYLEVFVDAGSRSLRDYIVARKANEGFVGGLYPSDPFSNVSDGYGIFGSSDLLERKDRLNDPRLMRMSGLTLQYLSESDLTRKLGFESVNACY